nr:PREDICTED: C-type lectin domain family 4 member A [Anolis carolinensis]|eukprot:XP_008121042.1 PREDICTED: C-type lectin domain family 4 member A [Anolis carolinensis]
MMHVFRDESITWQQAKELCKFEKAAMLKIESDEEELYIEDYIRGREVAYWMALRRKKDDLFYWDTDGTEVPKKDGYWTVGEPIENDKVNCAFIKAYCYENLKCWSAGKCTLKARTICKVKAKPKWLT